MVLVELKGYYHNEKWLKIKILNWKYKKESFYTPKDNKIIMFTEKLEFEPGTFEYYFLENDIKILDPDRETNENGNHFFTVESPIGEPQKDYTTFDQDYYKDPKNGYPDQKFLEKHYYIGNLIVLKNAKSCKCSGGCSWGCASESGWVRTYFLGYFKNLETLERYKNYISSCGIKDCTDYFFQDIKVPGEAFSDLIPEKHFAKNFRDAWYNYDNSMSVSEYSYY